MYHAACNVEFQPFNRSYSQLSFLIFFIKSCFFLCAVAAVLLLLLPLLLPLLVSHVRRVSKLKKSAVCGLELAGPVCVPPPPCQTAGAVDATAAVPQFLDGPSAASAPAAAAAAIIDEWSDFRRGFCCFRVP